MANAGETLGREAIEDVEDGDVSGNGCQELHVLAVDDSHVDRKVIEKLLKGLSCKVTAVESARSALQFLGLDGERNTASFDALKVNLIMTDYSMPGMSGYELLKKIKESPAFREIPVVVMSSEKILAHIDRCLKEGAEEFLSKPLKLQDVERLTDSVMRGKEQFRGSCGNTKRKRMSDCHTLPLSQSSVRLLHPHGCGMSPPLQPPSSLAAPTSSSERSSKRLKVPA